MTTVARLVEHVAYDIRARGLKPGDRYLTTTEIGEQFDVSAATAHRALTILAERDMVIRRQHRGTFVGPQLDPKMPRRIQTVCILRLEEMRFNPTTRQEVDLLLNEVERQMPDVDVHLSYVPAADGEAYLHALLKSLRQAGELAGVLALSCTREIYRLLADEKAPTVIMGSLYSDQHALLPSVDGDEHQAGRLLMQYLIERKHRRIALLSDSEGRPGDNYFFDGVSEVLTEANMPHNALIIRHVPAAGSDVLIAQTRELLQMTDRPTAIAVRIPEWAATVARTLAENGLRTPEEVEIVYKDLGVTNQQVGPFSHVRPLIPFAEVAVQVGRMLHCVRRGIPLDTLRKVIPYELKLADGASHGHL